ncbi:MAG: acetolactate synthase [Paludibacteraceae bacterium]|nr:acetolactate synthase [Paludibacteraceae bacterium]HOI26023.1 acetolactate synthase [Paludibacteraceae bacterium]HOU67580.1 acetolactate synthase [Paludibacteraceae bacterium]HPH62166.1 acetolactate synthase [Paludibacteraceae bacterium]HQF49630.1 acetolactate synthase [Paludibacteraceae bacterium]
MKINQISVFLENKFGRLNEVLTILNKENIKVVAATVADTSEYGILRLLTTDQQHAVSALKANKVSANLSEVIAISMEPGINSFSSTVALFTKAGIDIEYMYCFSLDKKSVLVLRTNNIEAAYDVIRRNTLNYLKEEDLINL